jgi:hypothetical protein
LSAPRRKTPGGTTAYATASMFSRTYARRPAEAIAELGEALRTMLAG